MKKITLIAVLIIPAITFIGNVSAQTASPNGETRTNTRNAMASAKAEMQEKREEMRSTMASAKAQITQNRCELATSRVDVSLTRAETNHKLRVEQYNKIADKVQAIITELKSKSVNTSSLESALTTHKELIKKLGDEHNSYIQKLKDTKQYACGNSEGQYKDALNSARTQFLNVRKAALAVREHYLGAVRTELVKVREQLRSTRPTKSPAPVATTSSN